MRREVRDRVVVITGAGGGIGGSLARAFTNRGAKTALLDLDPTRLEAVAGSLRPAEVLPLLCDVTDPAACRRAIETVIETWGGVDILVANAGISHRSALRETDLAVIRRVVEVNLFGAIHCTVAALESITRRRGAILAISSVAGFAPLMGRTGYAASKHALHGFFDSLRAELHGTGVDITLACPSFVETGMDSRNLAGDGGTLQHAKQLIGKPSDPDDVARQLIRAVERRKRLLVVSSVARISFWLSRLAPTLYERVMRRAQARESGGPGVETPPPD